VSEMVIDSWAAWTRSRVGGTWCRRLSMRNGEPPRRSSRSYGLDAISASTDTGGQRRGASSLAGCLRGKELLRMAWEATGEGAHMTPRRRYASVNGVEICYFEIHGAGNPLVLPQGAFGTI
jgi:hypothetical protein